MRALRFDTENEPKPAITTPFFVAFLIASSVASTEADASFFVKPVFLTTLSMSSALFTGSPSNQAWSPCAENLRRCAQYARCIFNITFLWFGQHYQPEKPRWAL